MVLLDNREVRNGWQPLKEAVNAKLQKCGAEVVSAKRWDERLLAYPIKGQRRGTYLLIYYEGEAEANVAIARELLLSEPVLRHVILSCDAVPDSAHEEEAEFDASAVPLGDEEVADDAPEDGGGTDDTGSAGSADAAAAAATSEEKSS